MPNCREHSVKYQGVISESIHTVIAPEVKDGCLILIHAVLSLSGTCVLLLLRSVGSIMLVFRLEHGFGVR